MPFNPMKFAGAGLAVAIAFGLAASQGYGEISVTGSPKLRPYNIVKCSPASLVTP